MAMVPRGVLSSPRTLAPFLLLRRPDLLFPPKLFPRVSYESSHYRSSAKMTNDRIIRDFSWTFLDSTSLHTRRDVAIDTATITSHHTPHTNLLYLERSQPCPPLPTVDADSHYLRPDKPYSPTHLFDARRNNMIQGNATIITRSVVFT